MKKKLITKILSISVAGAVALTPAAAFGAQTEENTQTCLLYTSPSPRD